jgi:hypothetical protein
MAAQSVFTTQTPSTTDANDNVGYALGTRIHTAVAGTVLGVRWYFPSTVPTSAPVGGLYRRTSDAVGTLLGSVTFSGYTAGAWCTQLFASPVPVTAGDDLVAVVYTPNHYVASGGFFTGTSVVSGDLTAPADDSVTPARNGKFVTPVASIAYPTNSFNGGCYFADILFAADVVVSGTATVPLVTAAGVLDVTSTPGVVMSGGGSALPALAYGLLDPVVSVGRAGWLGLIDIIHSNADEYAEEERTAPEACPRDGEPLTSSSGGGILFCRFCGWRSRIS